MTESEYDKFLHLPLSPFLAAHARLWKFAHNLNMWCRAYAGSGWQEEAHEVMDNLGLALDLFDDGKEALAFKCLQKGRQLALGLSRGLRHLIKYKTLAQKHERVRTGSEKGRREWSTISKEWAEAYQKAVDKIAEKKPELSHWALAGLAAEYFAVKYYKVSQRTIHRNTKKPQK